MEIRGQPVLRKEKKKWKCFLFLHILVEKMWKGREISNCDFWHQQGT